MANYLKYTLSKEDTTPSKNKVAASKTYKTANMYVTSNKTQAARWNLDQVLDQSCNITETLSELDRTILRIIQTKFITDKLLTQDLFQFMIELINNQYRQQGLSLATAHSHKKMPMELKEKFKLQEDLFILKEVDKAVSKLLGTDLKLLKNFTKLFKQKLQRLIRTYEKNKKKEVIVEFEQTIQGFAFQKNKAKQEEPYSPKLYLVHKQSKLKKMKDKSKQSLGTMGSRQNNSGSRQNKSTNKGDTDQKVVLTNLLSKEVKEKKSSNRQMYDYTAIMSGSMSIRKRMNTEQSNPRQIASVEPKQQKSSKNQGFVFFRPQKNTLPPKRP